MSNKISIHQPNFFPWLPFFLKINIADVHIILNHVKYTKNSWTNRCNYHYNLRNNYLTIPVSKVSTTKKIIDVEFINNKKNFNKLDKTIEIISSNNKGKNILREIWFDNRKKLTSNSLYDFNLSIFFNILNFLEINTKIKYSNLYKNIDFYKKSNLVEKIFDINQGSKYLTGSGGYTYLSKEFKEKCILITPDYLNIKNEDLNIINFILKYGSESKDKFHEISKNLSRRIINEM